MAHLSGSLRAALALSAALLALRLSLAQEVGYGDAEALYACYGLHPQPAYVDHPGLVGALSRWLGGDAAPSPIIAHRLTALVSTLLPWLGFGAARAAGANVGGAFRTFFALALLPELSLGLFGLTPDLPLAVTWVTALGAVAWALRSPPGSRAALVGFTLAGLATGLAVLSKASGVLLLAALAAILPTRGARPHLRTAAPWCGVSVTLMMVAPLVAWEVSQGHPMLTHRLVSTQVDAGFSLRNVGALVGGQLLYVTPPFLVGAFDVLRHTWARRRDDAVTAWWLAATAVPGVPLALLCVWSRVAEPHWVAPAYLALALAASLSPEPRRLVARFAVGVGLAAPVLAYVLVATPVYPTLAGPRYVPRYDLVNDLHAWGPGTKLLAGAVAELEGHGRKPVVVTEHWTVAAQVHAALGPAVPVADRRGPSDFSRWYPLRDLERSPTLLHVTDDRFPVDVARTFPGRDAVSVQSTRIYRGGRVVRTIRVTRLDRSATARRPHSAAAVDGAAVDGAPFDGASAVSPAARSSSVSASGPGFGVVSSLSP